MTTTLSTRAQQHIFHIAYKMTSQKSRPIHLCPNIFNPFCTMGLTLRLDHTSNHSKIPPKSSHFIVAKLIAHMTEQL
jgi:hypothetical protein